MATSEARAGSTRRPVLLAAVAILALHAGAALAILLATRSPAPAAPVAGPAGSSEGTAPVALGAAQPGPSPAEAPPPVAAVRAEPPEIRPEILSAPTTVRAEPVVPLPPDPEDRADALAAVRQRRLAEMLEQRMRRTQGARTRPARAAR